MVTREAGGRIVRLHMLDILMIYSEALKRKRAFNTISAEEIDYPLLKHRTKLY